MAHIEYQEQIKNHLRTAYLLSDDRIDAVMPSFMATLWSLMQDLEKYSDANNTEALHRTGHALKGALLNLGLQEIAEIAFSIEKFNPLEKKDGELTDHMNKLKGILNKICNMVC